MKVTLRHPGGNKAKKAVRPAKRSTARTRTKRRKISRESVPDIHSSSGGHVLLMAAILLVGLVAYKELPVSALPEVDFPTIQIVTFYPGASPDVMSSAVTAPLERQFGEVPGLNQMTSISSDGSSIITLQFAL